MHDGSKSSQVYFIATFKIGKRKQRKTIQSPSQLYLNEYINDALIPISAEEH